MSEVEPEAEPVKYFGEHPKRTPPNQIVATEDVAAPSADEAVAMSAPPLVHGGLFVNPHWTPRLTDRSGSVRTDMGGVAEHWPRDLAHVMYPDLPNPFWYQDWSGGQPPVVPQPPVITGNCSPTNGPGDGGTVVAIPGSGFTGFTEVTIDGVAATGAFLVNDNEVRCTTPRSLRPSGFPYAASVVVRHPLGDATRANGFIYSSAPTPPPSLSITGITPDFGDENGGDSVTITGTNFAVGMTATIGGNAVSGGYISITEFQGTTPPGIAGAVDVAVTTIEGTATLPGGFTYTSPPFDPAVTGITPTGAPFQTETTATVTGTGFGNGVEVFFSQAGLPVASAVVVGWSDTDASIITPQMDDGLYDLNVFWGTSPVSTLANAFTVDPQQAPVIIDVTPSRGVLAGGDHIAISGQFFTGATGVLFGTTPGVSFVLVDDRSISVGSPPASAPGLVDVTVQSPSGDGTMADAFSYEPLLTPIITAVTPPSGLVTGGETVSITGQYFTGATQVLFGTVPASSASLVLDTEISAVTPASAVPGPVDVTVRHPTEGDGTLVDAFTYNLVPAIFDQFAPHNGPVLGGDLIVITGWHLTGTTEVLFGVFPGTDLTIVSDTEIRVRTAQWVNNISVPVPLTVRHPTGDLTHPTPFVYHAMAPVTVGDCVPSAGPRTGGTVVSIPGQLFTGFTAVLFDGVPATNAVLVSDSEIRAVVPASVQANFPAPVEVTVQHSPIGDSTNPTGFTYVALEPVINTVLPYAGQHGSMVSIQGQRLTGFTEVLFDGVPGINTQWITDTEIWVIAPEPTRVTFPVNVDVTVVHPLGDATATDAFTYLPPVGTAPTISSITPSLGDLSGGNTFTIIGTEFVGPDIRVYFSGTIVPDLVVVSPTELTGTVPPNPNLGPVDVNLAVGTLFARLLGGYTYVTAPEVLAISPWTGQALGGVLTWITGRNLTGFTGVLFDGVPGGSPALISDDTLWCVSPASTQSNFPAHVDLIVQHPYGDVVRQNGYTYSHLGAPPPTITAITPDVGSVAGGEIVTITGTEFMPIGAGNYVYFGSNLATDVTIVNNGVLTCRVPAGVAPGLVDLTVINWHFQLSARALGIYLYEPLPVVVNACTPNHGWPLGGTLVTIQGQRLTGFTEVTFGGVRGLVPVLVSDTEIRVRTPPHTLADPYMGETVDIVVAHPRGDATLTDGYTYDPLPVTLGPIIPNNGPSGGGTLVTLQGLHFTGFTGVMFGTEQGIAPQLLADYAISVITPPTPEPLPAVVDVVVQHPYNDGVHAGGFTYNDMGIVISPEVTSVTPATGSLPGGNVVTIAGDGFQPGGTRVFFGNGTANEATNVTVIGPDQLTCRPPAMTVEGQVDVTVVTAGPPQVAGRLVDGYEYRDVPTLTATINPNTGSGAGEYVVTISGQNFTGFTGVMFGNNRGLDAQLVFPPNVIAVYAPRADGPDWPSPVTVTVLHPLGDLSRKNAFTYTEPPLPTITSVSPATGSNLGGNQVTIAGTAFYQPLTVTFDGNPATNVEVLGLIGIRCNTPPGATGRVVDVAVYTPDGTAVLPRGFTYVQYPTLTTTNPNAGSENGGTTFTCTGMYFTPDATVTVGGNPCTGVVYVSPMEVRAVTPPGPVGPADVTLTQSSGTSTLPGRWTYRAAAQVTGITPNNGPGDGGNGVTITGTNFTGTTGVRFGNKAPQGAVTVVSDTQINCRAAYSPHGEGPGSYPMSFDVTVLNPGGNGVLPNGYTYNSRPSFPEGRSVVEEEPVNLLAPSPGPVEPSERFWLDNDPPAAGGGSTGTTGASPVPTEDMTDYELDQWGTEPPPEA